VSELLLGAPVFDRTLNVTDPLPVPLVAPIREIHAALLAALHSHEGAAATAIELLLVPDAPKVTSLGVTVTVQADGNGDETFACCVTFTVWPATVIDAERAVVAEFAATVKFTFPVPVPLVPLVSTTHDASARALHGHPFAAVTVIPPLPPLAGMVCSVEESSKRQAAASWRMRARSPLTTMSPCRPVASGFAATCMCTSPLP
jgi:hypothetical protein